MTTSNLSNPSNKNRKPKRPIGNYIMLAIAVLMILYYLVYVNGYLAD